MERLLLGDLIKWKNSSDRKPLVLQGARQVGKTWLLEEFAKTQYENYVYLNFDKNRNLAEYFKNDLDINNLIRGLEIEFSAKIVPGKTLLIFDEIQESPRAIDSLKYFYEYARQYHVVSAGSFLGLASEKFPVGKVDRLTLFPLNFQEFLLAMGEQQLADLISQKQFNLIRVLSGKYTSLLKLYFYVGGMPKVLERFSQNSDFEEVRRIQESLLTDYEADFSKHIKGTNIPKVKMIWNSIPIHLSREKKKFIYKELAVGARASAFEDALDWLVRCGLVYRVDRT